MSVKMGKKRIEWRYTEKLFYLAVASMNRNNGRFKRGSSNLLGQHNFICSCIELADRKKRSEGLGDG